MTQTRQEYESGMEMGDPVRVTPDGRSGTGRLRVLIADNHAPTRNGVRIALEQENFVVCAECPDAESAIAAAKRHHPHVCLLEVRMPGNGISAARHIRAEASPSSVLIMLTVSNETADLREAIEAGATGYLLKDLDPRRLPLIIRRVVDGEMALPRSLTGGLVNDLLERNLGRRRLVADGAVNLTQREVEVLELVRDGRSTAEIARLLQIAPATVRSHVSRTMRKLKAHDRSNAAQMLVAASGRMHDE
jgi:two-component system nitrate/nitrite response regulator NarL